VAVQLGKCGGLLANAPYDRLTYLDVISKKLKVMDATAITMCMEANLPICVFKMEGSGCVMRAIRGESAGTLVE